MQQMKQLMYMIARAIDSVMLAFKFANPATKIGVQFRLRFPANPRFTILGAEDYMSKEIGEGSAHVAPPELSDGTGNFNPQLALWAIDIDIRLADSTSARSARHISTPRRQPWETRPFTGLSRRSGRHITIGADSVG